MQKSTGDKIAYLELEIREMQERLEILKSLKKLEEKQKRLPKIKNMLMFNPEPEELRHLPETLEVLVLHSIDNDFESKENLPLFLKEVILFHSFIKKEDAINRFKLPFGCELTVIYHKDDNVSIVDYLEEKNITKKNLYNEKTINDKKYYFNVEERKCSYNFISKKNIKQFEMMPDYICDIVSSKDWIFN